MTALRHSNIVTSLLNLVGLGRRPLSPPLGPGCTCESCVKAWDRHRPAKISARHEPKRRLRLGLY